MLSKRSGYWQFHDKRLARARLASRRIVGLGPIFFAAGCMSPTGPVNGLGVGMASTIATHRIPASPRVTFDAAISLLAAGQLPTIDAVTAAAKTALGANSSLLTVVGIDQVIPCRPEWSQLGTDGVAAETMRVLCRHGQLRRIVFRRNDAAPYGYDDAKRLMSDEERAAVYARDDEVTGRAQLLGLRVIDVSGSDSYLAEQGHMRANTPALLVTSSKSEVVIRADAFADGAVVGIAVFASGDASS